MLPENPFIHLIDTDLQNIIANCKDMDKDATEALVTLLDQGFTSLQTGLENWTIEEFGVTRIVHHCHWVVWWWLCGLWLCGLWLGQLAASAATAVVVVAAAVMVVVVLSLLPPFIAYC